MSVHQVAFFFSLSPGVLRMMPGHSFRLASHKRLLKISRQETAVLVHKTGIGFFGVGPESLSFFGVFNGLFGFCMLNSFRSYNGILTRCVPSAITLVKQENPHELYKESSKQFENVRDIFGITPLFSFKSKN
jgi:hypothetical protein